MWQRYFRPTTLEEAIALARDNPGARLVAGGTDLVVELRRGVRPTDALVDLTAIGGLKYVAERDGAIELGALATHNDVLASALCHAAAFPLVDACLEVGAPQIRTRGTIAGNLVTASPANDTIPALVALHASLAVVGANGESLVSLECFYPGFRQTTLRPGELVRALRFPALGPDQRGAFVKLGLRGAQAISVVNAAVVLRLDGAVVADARIALGCVAPTVVRAAAAEAFLRGRRLDPPTIARAGELALDAASPIDDVRGSAQYRRRVLPGLVGQALERALARPQPSAPVLLETPCGAKPGAALAESIRTTVNDVPLELTRSLGRTLLEALRDEVGLTGTKEGCGEGECGACTVWLDGQAVMACLTPAAQAHGARVTTIEGLARDGELHPVQRAFVEHGAVQCGYCIPGFVMAGAKLLEERPRPEEAAVRVALSGNVCRCTGYRKIFDAVIAGGAG